MPFDEVLTDFFEPEDRAVLNDSKKIYARFTADYVDALGRGASEPAVECISSEVEGVQQHDRLTHQTRGEEVFRIVGSEPDGTGMTVLRLAKAG